MKNEPIIDKNKLLLIISDPGKSWEEGPLLEYDKKESKPNKPYCVSDSSTVTHDYKTINYYCFALLPQENWKDNIQGIIEKKVLESNDSQNGIKADDLYIYIHDTDGPSDQEIIDAALNFSYRIIIDEKHIKRFKHVDNHDYRPVKNILKAAADLKNSPVNENKIKFAYAFKDALENFISYATPDNLVSLHLVVQGISLLEKNEVNFTEDDKKDKKRELTEYMRRIVKEKNEDIKEEIEGLKKANDNDAIESLENVLATVNGILSSDTANSIKQLEESLNCLYKLKLWYPE